MFLKEKKNFLIIVFSLLVLLVVVGFVFLNKKPAEKTRSTVAVPTEELIPTVDSSVKVDFKPLKKGEVLLTVANEPKDTKQIDFELSYQVINNDVAEGGEGTVEQGALGKCYRVDNSWQCGEANTTGGRKIILGTCSSGTCRYHNIVGSIKVVLKFSGTYGEKIFEKEFNI
jgi:hypothetical protein